MRVKNVMDSFTASDKQGSTVSDKNMQELVDNYYNMIKRYKINIFFQAGCGADMYEFKTMIQCTNPENYLVSAEKLMVHIELKIIDKG